MSEHTTRDILYGHVIQEINGSRYVDFEQLTYLQQDIALFDDILPLWCLDILKLSTEDTWEDCCNDYHGDPHYPRHWTDAELDEQQLSLAQLLHPSGQLMSRFRSMVWLNAGAKRYAKEVSMSKVMAWTRRLLICTLKCPMHLVHKTLNLKCMSHFDFNEMSWEWEQLARGYNEPLIDL